MRALRLLTSSLILAVAAPALAQRVVVLDFAGDRREVVRGQVTRALVEAGQVQLVAPETLRAAAAARAIPQSALLDPENVRLLAAEVGFDALITGDVDRRFTLRIVDATGTQVWSKELPLSRRRLSSDNARRLAAAIAVAATPAPPPEPPPEPTADAGTPGEPEPQPPPAGVDAGVPAPRDPEPAAIAPPPPAATPAAAVGPRLFVLDAAASTTWRSYCSRPTVSSCGEYDQLAEGTEPPGETLTFRSAVPYVGYSATAELFPLAGVPGWFRGFGIKGGFAQAFSQTRVRIANPNTSTPPQVIASVDTAWSAEGVFRWYFPFGADGLAGFVGAHGGVRAHSFRVDPAAATLLASSVRQMPAAGLEAKLPLARLAQLELTASYLLNPQPGPEVLDRYGIEVSSLGVGATAALSGEVWGPLGYVARFSFELYRDQFVGTGTHWFAGGVAEETYATLYLGARATF